VADSWNQRLINGLKEPRPGTSIRCIDPEIDLYIVLSANPDPLIGPAVVETMRELKMSVSRLVTKMVNSEDRSRLALDEGNEKATCKSKRIHLLTRDELKHDMVKVGSACALCGPI
jgi:hypothetical protein